MNGLRNTMYLYVDSQGYFVATDLRGVRFSCQMPGLAVRFLKRYKRENPGVEIIDNWNLPWHTRFLATFDTDE